MTETKATIAAPAKAPTANAAGSGPQESNHAFEQAHARDEGGKFTSGPDLNRGSRREPATGTSGKDVAELQRLLAQLGYGTGLIADGKFGPKTAAALARAQANHGITGEDGRLGPKTRAALRAELALVGGPGGGKGKGGGSRRRKPSGGGGKKPKRALADGTLKPEAGEAGKPWPKAWGKEPPKKAPGGGKRLVGYKDGSAEYEGGVIYDATTKKFRARTGGPSAAAKRVLKERERMARIHGAVQAGPVAPRDVPTSITITDPVELSAFELDRRAGGSPRSRRRRRRPSRR